MIFRIIRSDVRVPLEAYIFDRAILSEPIA